MGLTLPPPTEGNLDPIIYLYVHTYLPHAQVPVAILCTTTPPRARQTDIPYQDQAWLGHTRLSNR